MNALSSRLVATALVAAVALAVPACTDTGTQNERWVTTQDTTVDIDWDAIGKAYREAEGPEDFEKRVNEIYLGPEVVSVSVTDLDAQTQEVTGFFDENTDGRVADAEKIFTIRRDIRGDEAEVRIDGHGPYYGYHSPVLSIAAGMWMGSMMARSFSPGYVPAYSRPYVTSGARRGQLVAQRNAYRKANPNKAKASRSGRAYGRKGGAFNGGKQAPSRPRTRAPRPRGGRSLRPEARRHPQGREVVVMALTDLPFEQQPPKPLLGLDVDRDEPDLDFAGFGWGHLPALTPSTPYGARRLLDALVFAVHTPDEPGDALELEFWLDDGDDAIAAMVPWPLFADRILRPRLGAQREVVLAMCNPNNLRIAAPAWLGSHRLHYAEGDVISWLDRNEPRRGAIQIARAPMADRNAVNAEARRTYAGMFVLKLLDLQPEDGGTELEVILPHDLEPFDPVLESLAVQGYVEIERKKGRYALTPHGEDYLGTQIDEAEMYIDELDGRPPEEIVRRARARKLDPMRVRFLWGWYQGEFDRPRAVAATSRHLRRRARLGRVPARRRVLRRARARPRGAGRRPLRGGERLIGAVRESISRPGRP